MLYFEVEGGKRVEMAGYVIRFSRARWIMARYSLSCGYEHAKARGDENAQVNLNWINECALSEWTGAAAWKIMKLLFF